MLLDLSTTPNWCLSGGASGADLEWGVSAGSQGHGVIHYSFAGHVTEAPEQQTVLLTRAQLEAADQHCQRANKTLRRHFPPRSRVTTNLLRRDWYQVKIATACYGVSTFEQAKPGPTIPLGTVLRNMKIKGGTAWATQMFIDRHDGTCACYLFDQILCHWFQWVGQGWQCIYSPPRPQGIYAGIGIRELLPIGRLAIRVLMDYAVIPERPSAREQAERIARRQFEERARLLEGHKMGSWESLPDLMKEALIHHEMVRND